MKKIILMLVALMLCVGVFSGCDSPDRETRDIKGLKLTTEYESSLSGTFFLGFGAIKSENNTEMAYYLYIKGEEGFRLQSIPSSKVELVETNEVEPCIKGYFENNSKIPHNVLSDYIIYVPEGTIYVEYDANISRGY